MSRMDELVLAVAADLSDGRVPLSHEFLVEHQVTADECIDLTNKLGNILAGYVKAPSQAKALIMVTGVLDEDSGITPDIVWLSGIQNWTQSLLADLGTQIGEF